MTVSVGLEFGSDLDFKAPSSPWNNGLSKEEDYDDESWDFETGQPRFLLTENAFSIENDSAKIDLKWFKEVCDQIANLGSSSSHISGDELAMTLLSVLDSQGTGEEVFICYNCFLSYYVRSRINVLRFFLSIPSLSLSLDQYKKQGRIYSNHVILLATRFYSFGFASIDKKISVLHSAQKLF